MPPRLQDQEVNHRWQARVKHVFEALRGTNSDTAMCPIESIFYIA